jgi:hypothetical protein
VNMLENSYMILFLQAGFPIGVNVSEAKIFEPCATCWAGLGVEFDPNQCENMVSEQER